MQFPVNIIRILIFACALVCMTIDAISVRLVSFFSIDGYYIVGLLIDIATIAVTGYYIFNMEKRKDIPPTNQDYAVCGTGGILWMIIAILKFVGGFETVTAIYGLIVTILHCACGAILYQWNQKLMLHGGSIPLNHTNIGANNATNNPGFGMNSPGVGMNNPGVGMNNPGVGMNNSGFGMNNSGVRMNNPSVGMNNPGARMNNPGSRMNNPGARMNNPEARMNNPEARMNNPGARMNNPEARMNNPGARMNNPTVGMNRPTNSPNGTINNAGAEYAYAQ